MERADEALRLTTFNLATLCMIRREPRSGYDIRKEFGSTPVGSFTDSPGAIYPALRKLEASGLIEGRVAPAEPRSKRLFRLTTKGRRALEERMRQTITRRDVVWHLDDLMIRFVYAEEVLGLAETLDFARSFEREVGAFTSEFESFVSNVSEGQSLTARLALENGLESYQQQLTWSRRAIQTLENEMSRSSK